jgi:putative protein kinase ArgK-like GTPase of G3E family
MSLPRGIHVGSSHCVDDTWQDRGGTVVGNKNKIIKHHKGIIISPFPILFTRGTPGDCSTAAWRFKSTNFVAEISQLGMKIIAVGTFGVAASNVHASRPRV